MLYATAPHQSRPPAAPTRPETITLHGRSRTDDYRWMQDLDAPRMQEFLRANNAHLETVMAPWQALRQSLLEEMRALTPPDEGSAGYCSGPYMYRTRFNQHDDYPVFLR
ncbi:MAG: hypothetical protein LC725_07185, partial [Lentisphaerae bacterium]|nr:hypothetical protein [Lentisphaerota bacterium]